MRIDVLTLFPEMFSSPLSASIIKRARERGLLDIHLWNIRDFARDKHRIVDDIPYGGGAGMVLKPDVVVPCIETVLAENPEAPVIYLTPQGETFTQQKAEHLAGHSSLILLCGHYEGLDERVRTGWIDQEISIGDFVLTGGELPAMVVIDAVARLIPGVLGKEESAVEESFVNGLLEYPQYTRPAEYRGLKVPEVLLSGHHEKIRAWRLRESLRRTLRRRPDLLEKRVLSKEEKSLLNDLSSEDEGR